MPPSSKLMCLLSILKALRRLAFQHLRVIYLCLRLCI